MSPDNIADLGQALLTIIIVLYMQWRKAALMKELKEQAESRAGTRLDNQLRKLEKLTNQGGDISPQQGDAISP